MLIDPKEDIFVIPLRLDGPALVEVRFVAILALQVSVLFGARCPGIQPACTKPQALRIGTSFSSGSASASPPAHAGVSASSPAGFPPSLLSTLVLDVNKHTQLDIHVNIGVTHVMEALALLVQAGLLRPSYSCLSPSGCFVRGLLRLVFCFVPRTVTIPIKLRTMVAEKTNFQLSRDASWLIKRALPPQGEVVALVCGQFFPVILLRLIIPVMIAVAWWKLS